MNKLFLTSVFIVVTGFAHASVNDIKTNDLTSPSIYISNPDSIDAPIRITSLPGKGIFTVDVGQESDELTFVEFYDHNGERVASAQFMEKKTHSLNLQGLSPGKYTVRIKKGVKKVTHIVTIPDRGKKGTMEHYK